MRSFPFRATRPHLLVNMNLLPLWVPFIQKHAWEAVHWSTLRDPGVSDKDIMDWARNNQYFSFTHDLDIVTMLALRMRRGRACYRSARRTLCWTFWRKRSFPLSLRMGPI